MEEIPFWKTRDEYAYSHNHLLHSLHTIELGEGPVRTGHAGRRRNPGTGTEPADQKTRGGEPKKMEMEFLVPNTFVI